MSEGIKTRRGKKGAPEANLLYLFKDGDKCLDLTGGWVDTVSAAASGGNKSAVINWESNRVALNAPLWGGGTSVTVNNINLLGYTHLCVEYTNTGTSSNMRFGIMRMCYKGAENSINNGVIIDANSVKKRSVAMCPLKPGLTSEKLEISWSNTAGVWVYITKIWLEEVS